MPVPHAPRWRLAAAPLAAFVLAGLTGCEALKTDRTAQAPTPAASVPEPGSAGAPQLPQPVSPVASEPRPAPATEPAAPAPSTPREVQSVLASALEHLQGGNEAAALADIERVLQAEPQQRLARSLLRQVREDPQVLLGREWFAYRVQAGETLSLLAQRFLGDVGLFYALARYNGIKVPRQLGEGQTLRIPGTGGPAAMQAETVAPASSAPELTPAQRASAVQRLVREARRAFVRQDLDAAIRAWDAVIALDPEHRAAQLERQRALELKQRLDRTPR